MFAVVAQIYSPLALIFSWHILTLNCGFLPP